MQAFLCFALTLPHDPPSQSPPPEIVISLRVCHPPVSYTGRISLLGGGGLTQGGTAFPTHILYIGPAGSIQTKKSVTQPMKGEPGMETGWWLKTGRGVSSTSSTLHLSPLVNKTLQNYHRVGVKKRITIATALRASFFLPFLKTFEGFSPFFTTIFFTNPWGVKEGGALAARSRRYASILTLLPE